jgi:hypothetical protein
MRRMLSLVVLTVVGQTSLIGQFAAPPMLCHHETNEHMGSMKHVEG